jgi:hypothetical protein
MHPATREAVRFLRRTTLAGAIVGAVTAWVRR